MQLLLADELQESVAVVAEGKVVGETEVVLFIDTVGVGHLKEYESVVVEGECLCQLSDLSTLHVAFCEATSEIESVVVEGATFQSVYHLFHLLVGGNGTAGFWGRRSRRSLGVVLGMDGSVLVVVRRSGGVVLVIVTIVLAFLFGEETVAVVVLVEEEHIFLSFLDGSKDYNALGLSEQDGDFAFGIGTEIAYHHVALGTHVLHAVVHLDIEALAVLAGDDGGGVAFMVVFLMLRSGLCHGGESEEAECEE